MAGVVSILAKHLVGSPFFADIASRKPPRSNLNHNPAHLVGDASAPQSLSAAGSEGSLSSAGDPKVAELNAKIRKKLEEEMARESKSQAAIQALRAHQRQQSWEMLNAGRVPAQRPKDWSYSDAKMLQKFLGVLQSRFNVQVKLQPSI